MKYNDIVLVIALVICIGVYWNYAYTVVMDRSFESFKHKHDYNIGIIVTLPENYHKEFIKTQSLSYNNNWYTSGTTPNGLVLVGKNANATDYNNNN
jgi:hypothetical protein